MDYNLKTVFWNVRGLNSGAKCTAVRSMISAVAPTIVCLQETKLAHVSDAIVLEMLGPSFEDYFFLPAAGTCGGILLACQRSTISLSLQSPHRRAPHYGLGLFPGRRWSLVAHWGVRATR
ncbi:hypothetical protein CFC21_097954 [Triticum aestivum]|uniref:Endonuclease/exonuclease/phosphatase domain-containing protein n=2 Tax=Triticum aestivum TaxID=4565 RepID=A0A9R1N077_WHEAT|nr:hypothetical protein CFC21_097954 [Triticum aestivum]